MSRRPRGELGVVSLADRAEQLLGKERVALRAGQDRRGHRRRQGAGARVEQRRELRALERPELEDLPRTGAPDAVGQPAQPGRRRRLVGAQRREQEDAPGVEVVREVDDDVKRRGVGPVQVLENEQHGDRGGALAQQRERRLEYASLRAAQADPSERPQRLGERLEGKLGSDEVQRAPEQHLEAGLTRADANSDANRVLPIPASPAKSTVAPPPARDALNARSSTSSSRTRPTNAALARTCMKRVSP